MNGPALADVGYDVDRIRKDFPILSSTVYGKPLVYLDNAASAQKPQVVIDAITDAYAKEYSNVHRGMHYLSNIATERFEQARETAREFLNAESSDEIVFTSGATDAINLVASSFAEPRIEPGDEIILSILEHHSNIVPWHFLRERHGAVLKFVPVTNTGDLDVEAYRKLFTSRTKMVALTQMSNALGTITPIREMIKIAHERDVPVLVDGCQGVVHMPTDVRDMDCDFLVCSGHKLYGPTGIGLLYAKSEHLKAMRPYRGGGEMIREVSPDKVTYAAPPHRFEAGTPAIVQAIGLGAALSYIQSVGRDRIAAHETVLRDYATRRLSEINSLRIIGTTKNKGSIVSFVMENAHPHDIATVIDRAGVAVRAGHHCAQPVMERFGVGATTRASFGMYNTLEEVDRLADALIDSKKFFG
ncbi:MAG: cysteine desulfurase [Parvibaculum sp.]|jgi:cysteine desulfurase/selenocysteine lyase|uniref:cysteine desulfurase n=1 Tax=Parvibaculum sp. TaxID=2024848 RepID=UPI000C52E74E|nr:cysteine desulfurase [Parvibaculum sp.]MAU60620.1 cysteine desulfurase [Parvibaculum sp.]|tara:strand:- start:7389 stop:8633 length:1245 start_codon:yes stop_codon:yes gene_type:complete